MTLVVDHLFKRFGSVVALDDLAFEVPQGQVFGFLGANGAGKTTTMRIALGVLEPDAGRVTWRGVESHRLPRSAWGYLPEERGLYPRMRVLEQLEFFGGLHGVPADRARRDAMDWLRRFRAEDLADRRAEQLSKGNQQKIQFIAAVLHDPQVLLMDEPFTGLDPVNVMLLREAFLELRDRGRTVVFSTHQMEVAEALCESVAIVDRGRVVVGGPIREVRRATGRRMVRISVADDHRLPWLADLPGTRMIQVGMDRSTVELDAGLEPEAVLAAADRRRRPGPPLRDRGPQPRAGVHRPRRPPGRRGDPPGPGRRRGGGDRGRRGCRRRHAASRRGRGRRVTGSPHAVPPAPPEAMPESSNGTNVGLVARREYIERVRSRAFVFSTLLLIGLAVVVALIPLGVRLLDRATVTQVGVVADDAALAARGRGGHGQRAQRAAPGRGPGRAEVRLRAAHGRGRDGRRGPQRRGRRRHPHRAEARQAASTSRC